MTIKLAVASRLEYATDKGTAVNASLMSVSEPNDKPNPCAVKIELAGMSSELAASFSIGRILEIEIPTYSKPRIISN